MRRSWTFGSVVLALMALMLAAAAALAQDATPTAAPMAASEDCPSPGSAIDAEAGPETAATQPAVTEPFTFGDDGSVTVNQYPAEYEDLLPGVALITFVNTLEDDTPVTFYRDDVPFASSLVNSSANQVVLPVDAGTYSFSAYDDNNPDSAFAEQADTTIVDSYYYVIAAVDGANGPEMRIQEVSRADYALANGQLFEPGTVIDTLNSNGLCYIADAIESAGLTETLTGEGPYTLFVPADYLRDEVAAYEGDLEALLLNHVVEGDLKSFDLNGREESLTTLAGSELALGVDGDAITVNGSRVLQVNLPAINGTVHVIDGILTAETEAAG